MAGPRVIIVGAGPAGIRCAEALVQAGLAPVVIDENERCGGQIYRQQPESFRRDLRTLYGADADRARAVHECFAALRARIDYRPRSLAWNVAGRELFVVQDGRASTLPFDVLILCTGATDRLLPLPGWNLAGTYSLGGSQVALKSQACAVGRQIVFMGTGPLLYLVAAQHLKAGARPVAVLDTSPAALRRRALPQLLSQPGQLLRGLGLVAGLRAGSVPCLSGIEPLAIEGNAQEGVRALRVRDARGRERRFDCDAVALGYHLRSESQLAELAGCALDFDAAGRQWLPRCDEHGRSSVPGVYLAGDGARILGARAAETAGTLAALAALQDSGQAVSPQRIATLQRELQGYRRFADGLRTAFPWPAQLASRLDDATPVCRCENISAGELRHVVRDFGATESNRAKAFSRVGMGRCQGRYCAHASAEIIAEASGCELAQAGRLRAQAPVKPISIGCVQDGT